MNPENEVLEFKGWLEQFQLSPRTTEIYMIYVNKFLKSNTVLTERSLNIFLKHHPRLYVRQSLRYYLRFKNLDKTIDIARVKEPPVKLKDVLTYSEILDILNTSSEEIRKKNLDVYNILYILSMTGARITEVLRLKISDVDFNKNEIRFRTKGNQFRVAGITPKLSGELKEYYINQLGLLGNDKLFFIKVASLKASYFILRRWLDRLKLDRFKKTHNFRRAIINEILEKTDNVKTAQYFIGHKDPKTTDRYVSERVKEKLKAEGEAVILGKS